MIRVVLPAHLRALARIEGELSVAPAEPTACAVIDEIEARFPMLRGTIRDQHTKKRRPYIRFFACERDLSHERTDEKLPQPVADGHEPFLIVGAVAGG